MTFRWLRYALLTTALAGALVACGDDGGDDNGGDAVCGDGTVQTGETCDDGNTADGDGCSAVCTSEADAGVCGDGAVDEGETCDDGNTDTGDGCNAECVEEVCGNGVVDDGEGCDDGNTDEGDGCDASCVSEFCGDGMLDEGEVCDDGNNEDGDGCRADCLGEEICGDGTTDVGEACDDGNMVDGDGCSALCVAEFCGDGAINDVDEVCDDGNTEDGDGCRADCAGVELCGDMLLDLGEVCDDGNMDAGDGCRSDCLGEEICSDGILDVGEGCDDGNMVDGDGCSMACMLEATPIAPAGMALDLTGTLDGTEMQWARPNADCTATTGIDHYYDVHSIVNDTGADQEVTITATWLDADSGDLGADGYIHVFGMPFDAADLTTCIAGDDEYDTNGNGVTREGSQLVRVAIAAGESLTIVPSSFSANDAIGAYSIDVFTESCGNAVVDGGEACDDGNVIGGDGCSADCLRIEICGDAVLDPGEVCDDGNQDDSDGCSATCTFEDGIPLPIALPGSSLGVGGTLDGTELQWDRPSASCSATGSADHYYDLIAITNATGADQYITVTAAWNGDGFLHLYRDPFDPADTATCIVGNDQFNGSSGSQIVGEPILDGEVLYIVASTWTGNAVIGDYTIDVDTLPPAVCGDGATEGGEQCDDGNLVGGDGCSATCQDEVCGDGIVNQAEEVCDDGNTDGGDGCRADCAGVEVCGDSLLDAEAGEQCDDGGTPGGLCLDTCQIDVTEVEVNDTAAEANAYVDPFIGFIGPAGDFDYVAVVLSAGALVTAEVADLGDGSCAALDKDTELTLYDTDGVTELAFNEDISFSSNYCSRLSYTVAAAGTYYFRVASSQEYAPDEVFSYELLVSVTGPPTFTEVESNDTFDTANAYSSPFVGSIAPAFDFDYVAIDAVMGQTITAETVDLGDGACAGFDLDSELRLYDTDGVSQVAFSEDEGGGFCSLLSYTVPATGTYYLRVAAYQGGDADGTFNYELVVDVTDP